MKLYQKIAHCLQAIENCKASGNNEWQETHSETLRTIEREYLPHGSGFDWGCRILETSTPQKLAISCDWHRMDSNGFYCGRSDYVAIVRPCLLFDFDVTIKGRDWNQVKEYVHSTMQHALNEEYRGD